MYSVVRLYRRATHLFDLLETRRAEVQELMGSIPGFVAFYCVRTSDGGVAVTVCQDRAGGEESTRRAADWIRVNLPAAAVHPPEVLEGEVIIQRAT
jgi:hypothetical protein